MSEHVTTTPQQQQKRLRRRWWLLLIILLIVVGLAAGIAVSRGAWRSDPATWEVSLRTGAETPGPDSTEFTALVTRQGCNSGVTGDVNDPKIVYSAEEIVVTFSVAAEPWNLVDANTCPGNERVPYLVTLDEPIRDRWIVDGGCTLAPQDCVRWPISGVFFPSNGEL